MACVRDEAHGCGWVSASTTALPGMLEDLYEQALAASRHLIDDGTGHLLTSLSVGPVSASWELERANAGGNWRSRMTRLIERLEEHGAGLLVTVDEVQGGLEELVRLAATYQHFVTEGRKVALVMAGLPHHVHRLVSDRSVSFLCRSVQHQLGRIPDADVGIALRKTVEGGGKGIGHDAVGLCTEATGGFAFMLQLVGYRTWLEAGDDKTIRARHARRGIEDARLDMEHHVLASTYRELSAGDLRFVEAMTADRHESHLSDVAARMGVTNGYASRYKARLLAAGVIGERARGVCGFDIPGFREYVEARMGERGDGAA